MLQQIDTNQIRESVSLLALASDGNPLTRHKRGYHYGACPFCGEGDDRFKVFDNGDQGQYFYCRRCERKGDVIQFVMLQRGLSFPDAAKWLTNDPPVQSQPKTAQNGSEPLLSGAMRARWSVKLNQMAGKALNSLVRDKSGETGGARQWLDSRGIGKAEISHFALGYNDQWREIVPGYRLPPGIIMPRWNQAGEMVACNVYLAREARELTGQRRMYARGSRPKDAFWNQLRIEGAQDVYICEGELDAVLLQRFLPPHACAVATGGADTIPNDLSMLEGKRVIIVHDNDQAGERMAERWRELYPAAALETVPMGKDVTDFWQAGGDLADWLIEIELDAVLLRSIKTETGGKNDQSA